MREHAIDDYECFAEFIDGNYTYCGCPDCEQREYEDIEAEVEMGNLTEAEALDLHEYGGW